MQDRIVPISTKIYDNRRIEIDLQFPEDWQKRILKRFSEQRDTTPVIKNRADVEGRLLRLRELYIAGDISKEHYEQR